MWVAKPLERDGQSDCRTAIPGDFQTSTGLRPDRPDLDLKLVLLWETVEFHAFEKILPTRIFLLFCGIFYTGIEKKGSLGLGYIQTT